MRVRQPIIQYYLLMLLQKYSSKDQPFFLWLTTSLFHYFKLVYYNNTKNKYCANNFENLDVLIFSIKYIALFMDLS